MLKRLRLRIVAIVMSISVVVMALAFAAIMIATWNNASSPLVREMKAALERGPEKEAVLVLGRHGAPDEPDDMHEISFTPVAVVDVNLDGTVETHNDIFLSMDETVRANAVIAALKSPSDTGLLSEAGVLYYRSVSDEGVSIAFVDANSFISTMRSTATGVAAVFAAVLAILFLVSIALSRTVTAPVQRAWQRQSEFIADASHELKTPLTVILANADILQDHPDELTPEQAKWVSSIRSEARRMKGLVEEMLFLARGDSAATHDEEEPPEVDLADIARQSCLTFDAVAFEAGVEIEDEIAQTAPVRGERAKLERLVNILVDNAVKYAGTGGRVHVTVAPKKRGHAVLEVCNTGEPIPAEDLPRVFDRFWRSDRARTAPDAANASFGLGLSIAKSIAEEHGGHIGVVSDEENGTAFTVVL